MGELQVGIATDFNGESPQIEKMEEMLKKIAEAGFTHVHWCNEWDGDYMYSVYEMQQIKEWLDKYRLKAKALHATKGTSRDVSTMDIHGRRDYTSEIEYNRKAGAELIKNRVDLAACLGAHEIVLHLYVPYITFKEDPEAKERFYTQVYKSMDELQDYCAEKNVRICIENLFDVPEEHELEQLDRLFARYPASFLGFCLDSGHANMIWGDGMVEIIHRYKDRLFAVHLHDNNQTADSHKIPGQGSTDWSTVMKAIARTSYELPIVMELMCTEKQEEVFLKKAYDAGKWLTELYEKA